MCLPHMLMFVPSMCCYCVLPTAPNSPARATVTCQRPNSGWTGFGLTLTAVDSTGCMANVTNTATLVIREKPVVAINGAATVMTCASAPTLTLDYTVTSSVGGVLAVAVSTNATQVTCSVRNNPGESSCLKMLSQLRFTCCACCCS